MSTCTGCKNAAIDFGRVLGDPNLRLFLSQEKYISKAAFQAGDLLTLLEFAWAVDKGAVKKVFEEVGIEVKDEKDLNALVRLAANGKDKEGEVKQPNGRKIHFSVVEQFIKIRIPAEAYLRANVKFI